MKLLGFFVLVLLASTTDTDSYRLPLPYGVGFPMSFPSANGFFPKPIQGWFDFWNYPICYTEYFIEVEPMEPGTLIDAINNAFEAIEKFWFYQSRPAMELERAIHRQMKLDFLNYFKMKSQRKQEYEDIANLGPSLSMIYV